MDDDGALFEEVAAGLREVQQRIASLHGSEAEKADATRRFVAVTNAAKQDLHTAARRLRALLADLDSGKYDGK